MTKPKAKTTLSRGSRDRTPRRAAAVPRPQAGAAPVQWRAVRSEPAACRIERQIKAAILSRQFQVGDYLGSEHDLSAKPCSVPS